MINTKMNIKDLIQADCSVAITVTPADLREFALEIVNEVLTARLSVKEETYMTPDEAAKLMGVSKGTLWRWEKEKYLTPFRVGRKPRYKRSELDALMTGDKTKNED